MKMKDVKPIFQEIENRENEEKAVFNQILLDCLHSIPAHKNSEIKIYSIEPTLRGIYIIWSKSGTLQRYARTIEYHQMNELTKKFQTKNK